MRRVWCGLALSVALAACGHVTAPVPADDFGLGMRLQAERAKDEKTRLEQLKKEQATREAEAAKQKTEEGVLVPPDEVILPEMRPVGGR